MMNENSVTTEIGALEKILIHSPDGGIGKVIPTKFADWLYDDTVHMQTMQEEYDDYLLLLLYWMDPEAAARAEGKRHIQPGEPRPDIWKPDKEDYFVSDRVIEVQRALSDILAVTGVKIRLVSAVCAVEECSQATQEALEAMPPTLLAKTLITGTLDEAGGREQFVFPPLPNLVFTRDIGIVIHDHILLSKHALEARKRESLIAKYIFLYHPHLFAEHPSQVVEVTEPGSFFLEDGAGQARRIITIEGGDVMMVAPNHLLVGCSERTSPSGVDGIIHTLFSRGIGIEKITVVTIPQARVQMHIDTLFTQVARDLWVMYDGYSERMVAQRNMQRRNYASVVRETPESDSPVRISRFYKPLEESYDPIRDYKISAPTGLEELLRDISTQDFGVPAHEVKVIYSAGGEFPYNERERWTDSCNLLALKDGVAVGYDRNEKTLAAFEREGYRIIHARELLPQLRDGSVKVTDLEKTIITLASTELSRARGGSHCMSMPLRRSAVGEG